jgi:hypothetical protein
LLDDSVNPFPRKQKRATIEHPLLGKGPVTHLLNNKGSLLRGPCKVVKKEAFSYKEFIAVERVRLKKSSFSIELS